MSAFVEIFAGIIHLLLEVTYCFTRLAMAPLRWLFSSRYRLAAVHRWQGRPGRRAAEMLGGTVALLLCLGWFGWWGYVFTKPDIPEPQKHAETAKLRQYVVEKLVEYQEKRR